MAVTLRDMQRILSTLTPEAFSVLSRRVLGIKLPQQAQALTVKDQLQMLFWEWLSHLGFISDGQAESILKVVPCVTAANYLTTAGSTLPVFRVSIADHRFLQWTDNHGTIYDLVYDEFTDAVTAPPVTVMVCDFVALYGRAQCRLRALKEPDNADAQGTGRSQSPQR